MLKMTRPTLAALLASTALLPGLARADCVTSGVITRIEGRPADVIISRTDHAGPPTIVVRPRVLEMICQGDIVRVQGASSVLMSLDGAGPVRVTSAASYTVARRAGTATAFGNAGRAFNDQVMPDMKRMPWSTRLRSNGDDFGFALPGAAIAAQDLTAGHRALLVRLVGGTGPFQITLRAEGGPELASVTAVTREATLPAVELSPGTYSLSITDASHSQVAATVNVVAGAPPIDSSFAGVADAEVRGAMQASSLARAHPALWALEAEQLLNTAPATASTAPASTN